MERYKRAIDFIDFVKNLHHEIKEYCEKIYDNSDSEKVKMVLGYVAEHERKMEETLREYENGLSKSIEETWYQFIELPEKPSCLKNMEFNPTMSIDDVINFVSKVDMCLVKLYQKLAEISVSEEAQKIFDNLANMESNELRKVVQNIQRVDDI